MSAAAFCAMVKPKQRLTLFRFLRREVHPLKQLRVSWVGAQAIKRRLNLEANYLRVAFINSLFKPGEGHLFVTQPGAELRHVARYDSLLFGLLLPPSAHGL